MTEQTDFIETFTAFLRDVVEQHGAAPHGPGELTTALTEHLGVDALELTAVTERLSRAQLVDADIALDLIDPDARVIGFGGRGHDLGFLGLVRGEHGPVDLGPVEYVSSPVGPNQDRQVVASAVRLLTFEGTALALLQRDANPEWGRSSPTLEIMAADRETTSAFLARLRTLMRENSVLRGQVLSFAGDEYGSSLGGVTFHERPTVPASAVVLPGESLRRIERHALAMGEFRDELLRAGQHLKRGILLYGPPGTGKTHTVRHLLSRSPGITAILLSGNTLGLVKEATQIARAMEPAIVVLEDCDLVAEDRDMVDSPDSMLFELLEALDGLDGDADVTFLMTTNRPDLLERALSQRPGRIDLAVEIPLPDLDARRALFALYADGLGFSAEALDLAADRAEGVTASFAKELVRRAVLSAAIAHRPPGDADLTAALDELLSDQDSFTRSLLASGPRSFEDSPEADDWPDD
ncbi:AAA family ATPase [Aeromicrobium sp. 636]|uniref:26S protease regulatory subunit n=1 Tax=Aeromicrobium senzhongii TaxID=2663859 RepID=A0A8I0JZD5_9ACTN|nr:ATP-binding protein [Aeromicrobium sp. 636]MBC9225186.1 26S protease regulatory subunit [Aeromicrobium senzhongii]MCQ3997296.1 AAA family ATPase [Aeromicrobium sp. 636]